ncbi:MAG: type III-B CRISPR module-associated protein Cmr3 [Firmicutes bacterium]|nr:type III-B CRISPR module-associated protein Cmr3 [Candidatus Fermentithermobacillaceae bacterium]
MNVWVIEPRDPVIFRDGRPFGRTPGARALSLPFPFPSTIAGAVRTRDGLDACGAFAKSEIPRVKQLEVRGPLLVELDDDGDVADWYAPAPADAVLFEAAESAPGKVVIRPCVPLQLPPGTETTLPDGLVPVGLSVRDPRKSYERAPRFWSWRSFERWLIEPREVEDVVANIGFDGPGAESRMHVGIRPDTLTADEENGALFQTRGLEFTYVRAKPSLRGARRLALVVATDANKLKPGVSRLGGEGRLVFWRRSKRDLPPLPSELKDEIAAQRHCRVVLLTPAYFREGWKPFWLLSSRFGVTPCLRALALRGPQVVSGWDVEKGEAKPTRRLVPAGTVFFLSLHGESTSIRTWVENVWMRCVSDEDQDRRDGFGLAAAGVWDGTLHRLEV